ncbi:Hypothetical protein AT6N2_L2085 [Agrobacterium tumefaciens]|nr:Hypothetical protein AT6N2_L2085 [Agrobacterium tumefaciens]
MAGEFEHLIIEFDIRDGFENRRFGTNLVTEIQRRRDECLAAGPDEQHAIAAEKHRFTERRHLFVVHCFCKKRQRFLTALAAWSQIVGLVEIELVDLVTGEEVFDADDLVALRHQLCDFVSLDNDVITIVELVPFDLIVAKNRLTRIAIDILSLDAVAGLAVDDIEGNFLGRGQRGIKSDLTVEIGEGNMSPPAGSTVHVRRSSSRLWADASRRRSPARMRSIAGRSASARTGTGSDAMASSTSGESPPLRMTHSIASRVCRSAFSCA